MELQIIILFGIIFFLSIIQSIIGVGILLFGTPTLLLLGYTYIDTLALVIPSSLVISFLQIKGEYRLIQTKRAILFYTIPMVIIFLSVISISEISIDIKKIVGSMLLMIGLVRYFSSIKNMLHYLVAKNRNLYCIIMGAVHGLSNMGGGLLVIFMSAMFKTKNNIRINIAFGYLLFGTVQLLVLLVLNKEMFGVVNLFLPIVAFIAYQFIGKKIMHNIQENNYHSVVTFFVFFYGILSFTEF
jgi:uncharacterized membrane protein YfcA